MKNRAELLKQQKGIAHLGLLSAVIAVLVVGYAGYRAANNTNELSNADTINGTNEIDEIDSSGSTEDIEEVDLNNLNANEENSSTPIKGGGGPGDTPPARIIGFVKGGNNIDTSSGTVSISNTASEELSGICKYQIFKQPDYNIEFELESDSNGKTCSTSFPIDRLYGATGWDYQLIYTDLANNVSGHGGGYLDTSFDFTKGGGNFDGNNVVVSETSSLPHTGTCNFKFSLPGSPTVERTTTINNSRTCTVSIPGSEFANSGNWLYDLTFNSTPTLFTGTGGNFQILIQK